MLNKQPARQAPDVLSHWYTLIEGVQFSTQEFYHSLETELNARELPRLRSSRIEYHEGGVFSDKRIYLRLARERYAFDVCAAPFGTGYFFSLRFLEKPRSWLRLLIFLALIGGLGLVGFRAYFSVREYFYWVLGSAAVLALVYYLVISEVRGWATSALKRPLTVSPKYVMPDFDGYLLNMALIGSLYEAVRKDTYYREDTRLLFHTLVSDIVKKKVEEVTAEKGVKIVSLYEYSPILDELYKRTTTMKELPAGN